MPADREQVWKSRESGRSRSKPSRKRPKLVASFSGYGSKFDEIDLNDTQGFSCKPLELNFKQPGGCQELALLHWVLIPSWAKDPSVGNRMINARGETVASKPSFRAAFKKRRCLIVADGFYEWQKTDGPKQPFRIHLRDDRPFAFAGLWEHWKSDEQTIESCTIITTDANELMQSIHDRMPVILNPDDYGVWLDPEFEDKDKLRELLKPYAGMTSKHIK